MQRLNVRITQIRECIEKSMFAVDRLPHLTHGEILLLQLVKSEARGLGKLGSRIEFALVYDHYERDTQGKSASDTGLKLIKYGNTYCFVQKQSQPFRSAWKIYLYRETMPGKQIQCQSTLRMNNRYSPSFGGSFVGTNGVMNLVHHSSEIQLLIMMWWLLKRKSEKLLYQNTKNTIETHYCLNP